MSRIFITGMGVISAIGDDLSSNLNALRSGSSGISTLGLFPSRYSGKLPCAEVKSGSGSLSLKLGLKNQTGITRTNLLAIHAFEAAVQSAGLTAPQMQEAATAIIAATTVGGMCLTDELYHDAHLSSGGSAYLSSYDNGSVAISLQKRYQTKGIINTINTACSSSANAIMYGARLIRSGYAERAVVGGVDALAKFTLNGFNALHILSSSCCRPFDARRNGLNLGEGAAFLVLEKEEAAGNKKVFASLTGYGNANDSFHPSSLSAEGDGPLLSMQKALAAAALDPRDIDYINAHGTGTENNDESESRAMIRLFGSPPAFSSTKGNIGHTLGAAGAIEAVYSVLSLHEGEIYPSLHYQDPIPSTGLVPQLHYLKKNIRHVMSNSFGFGGNCTSLIFSKV